MPTYILGIALLVTAAAAQAAEVESSTAKFGPEGKYAGYMVRPVGSGPFPGIIVIHEWWGLNDHIRAQAKQLAESGYVALAIDLFGKSTTDSQVASQMARGLDQKAATAQLVAAAGYLRSRDFVRADRVGSIGWCFGGAQSLNLALNDPKLAAAVIYYGRPVTDPKELARIGAAILGIYGEADGSIPMEQVNEFGKAPTEAKVAHSIHTYPGAGHAFANPTRGDAYKPEAAKDAWKKTMEFLNKRLKS